MHGTEEIKAQVRELWKELRRTPFDEQQRVRDEWEAKINGRFTAHEIFLALAEEMERVRMMQTSLDDHRAAETGRGIARAEASPR